MLNENGKTLIPILRLQESLQMKNGQIIFFRLYCTVLNSNYFSLQSIFSMYLFLQFIRVKCMAVNYCMLLITNNCILIVTELSTSR